MVVGSTGRNQPDNKFGSCGISFAGGGCTVQIPASGWETFYWIFKLFRSRYLDKNHFMSSELFTIRLYLLLHFSSFWEVVPPSAGKETKNIWENLVRFSNWLESLGNWLEWHGSGWANKLETELQILSELASTRFDKQILLLLTFTLIPINYACVGLKFILNVLGGPHQNPDFHWTCTSSKSWGMCYATGDWRWLSFKTETMTL